jgi:hypothetical protein
MRNGDRESVYELSDEKEEGDVANPKHGGEEVG